MDLSLKMFWHFFWLYCFASFSEIVSLLSQLNASFKKHEIPCMSMDNKKLGFIVLGLSIIASVVIYGFMSSLHTQQSDLGCNPTSECQQMQSMFGLSHVGVGLIAFFAALGVYLLFFSPSEDAILSRLEEEKQHKVDNDKFSVLLSALDSSEQRVIRAIREQEGVTQSTLRFRTDLSKSKLSQILTSFERKNLIKRVEKGKTYEIYLAQTF